MTGTSGTDSDLANHRRGLSTRYATMMPGDRPLLCTDGLTDVVCDAKVVDALALRRRPDDAARILVDLAVLKRSTDDYHGGDGGGISNRFARLTSSFNSQHLSHSPSVN